MVVHSGALTASIIRHDAVNNSTDLDSVAYTGRVSQYNGSHRFKGGHAQS